MLVLASTYPRWQGDSEPGFVHELSRRLTDAFQVTVLCPASPGARRREEMDGVEIRRFCYAPDRIQTLVNSGGIVGNLKHAHWKLLLVPPFLLAELFAVWRVLRNTKPDVVHAHWLLPQGLIMALLGRVSKSVPPFLVTSHGADLHALKFWPMPTLKRFVARHAAGMTVVSSAMLEVMKAQGIPADRVRVEPMGVDLQHRFTPDESIPRSDSEILFVGRLVEKKGLRYLVEALPAILENHPDAHLTVVGFGPEEAPLRQQAAALGLEDKVNFLGAVSQDRLPDLYRRAAVFIGPFVEAADGDQEGLGLVTVEAVGCGCPVVVSDLPAVRDVIEEPPMKVPPANSSALAERVLEMLQMPAEERQRMAEHARQRLLRQFSWAARAASYAELLKLIAAGGR